MLSSVAVVATAVADEGSLAKLDAHNRIVDLDPQARLALREQGAISWKVKIQK
jgi:hypothetical protein